MTDAAVRGTTTVSEKAVRKIAERAAAEALPGFARPSARGSASVRGRRAVVSLGVTLPYPVPLASTAERVERHVTDRTGRLTGLRLEPARVTVTGLTGPARPSAPTLAKPPPPAAHRGARGRRGASRSWDSLSRRPSSAAPPRSTCCGSMPPGTRPPPGGQTCWTRWNGAVPRTCRSPSVSSSRPPASGCACSL